MSKAGKFREQITILKPVALVQNATGGFSPAAPVGSVLGVGTLPFTLGGGSSYASGSYASGAYGASTTTPTPMPEPLTLWARVETLTAKEVLEDGKLTYKQPYRITIRYTNSVANVDRVEWRGVSIAINSITQDDRQTEKVLVGYGTN